jgi:hypothetical protein
MHAVHIVRYEARYRKFTRLDHRLLSRFRGGVRNSRFADNGEAAKGWARLFALSGFLVLHLQLFNLLLEIGVDGS